MNIHAFQPIYKIYREDRIGSHGIVGAGAIATDWYENASYMDSYLFPGQPYAGKLVYTSSNHGYNLYFTDLINTSLTQNFNSNYGLWGYITGSWLGYPANADLVLFNTSTPYLFPFSTTRNSLYKEIGVENTQDPLVPIGTASYKGMAIAWGSFVTDMMWNATAMSWSITSVTSDLKRYDLSYNSTSSFFKNASPHLDPKYPRGLVNTYNITSSWHAVDYRLLNMIVSASTLPNLTSLGLMTGSGSPQRVTQSFFLYLDNSTSTASFYEDLNVSKSVSGSIGYTLNYYTGSTDRNVGFDKQFFDVGQGVGITRADISQSLTTMSWDGYGPLGVSVAEDPNKPGTYNGNSPAGVLTQSIALKKRRLYYPTTTTTINNLFIIGTAGALTSNDYYHKRITGYTADEVFSENGGIYNVSFTLKRYAPTVPGTVPGTTAFDYSPSDNSFLAVFIHNVRSNVSASSSRDLGDDGWYPPLNNIVVIGNNYTYGNATAPALTFFEPVTGYLYEKYSFDLVQYGKPAQLCFEACGDWSTGAAFGIIISDVKICKVGVTTDPNLIKPTSKETRFNDVVISTAGPVYPVTNPPTIPNTQPLGNQNQTNNVGIVRGKINPTP